MPSDGQAGGTWLSFALMTVVCWGVYGILLHKGGSEAIEVISFRRDGLQSLRDRLPRETRFVMATTLDGKSGFPVTATMLDGRGAASVAYRLRQGNKSALISGRVLDKLDNRRLVKELLADLAAVDGDTAAFRDTLDLLEVMAPDVWLPARPVNDQNANLYDQQWQSIIGENRGSIREDTGSED